ncbi:MAG: penicillin acylase family protein [Saprospiraceae bacterium]|jgi:penicillin G amidase|nr:penicillin acylase family protein [Saprospiraceae bacterium]MDP4820862.1 penicillin acylase family protein [Saprospiraceae bacterium]MDP4999067.1 penicillin acylase family protein [Saprospiraceae bacterium]
MKNFLCLALLSALAFSPLWGQQSTTLQVKGLEQEVEIIVDEWGIPHIYAQTEADLFFAQGYYAAKDRLFQFEVWRRQATGTVAEIMGPRELKRDIGTRLFRYRGDLEQDFNRYHPRGSLIIHAFVNGVNAAVEEALQNPDDLPTEFKLLGMLPGKWTPDVVISRHQGLLGNIRDELDVAKAVLLAGEEKVRELSFFHPRQPDLSLDPAIDPAIFQEDILELYSAFRRPIRFQPDDIVLSQLKNSDVKAFESLAQADEERYNLAQKEDISTIGSNNWIVSGQLTQSGYPIMANDPHRAVAAPSLRYMAHLVGPGWNVIGGGEPTIPGISIGHNEYGAWGLTIFSTDAEDLYIYKLNPKNPDQYWYQGAWETMRVIRETIKVKGQKDEVVELKYTRHGPVLFVSDDKTQAAAMRCGWLEPGGAPYMASLRMDQAKTWEEFREACTYSNIPGENMIWADKEGNIGWQSVGIAPIRRNFSGMVPVPGDGRYEWDGYLPMKAKPHTYNPASGFFATANENVTPNDYLYMDAIGYNWSDPFRSDRIAEFLSSGRKNTLMDMARLQTSYLSLPARLLSPMLENVQTEDPTLQQMIHHLLDWDYELKKNSIAAGIYNEWERALRDRMTELMVPEAIRPFISLQMTLVVNWLTLPDRRFGEDPIAGRNAFLLEALKTAKERLMLKLGTDMGKWQYGQPGYKVVGMKHPLSNAVKPDIREKLDIAPVPRGGNSLTVNNTGGGDVQTHGATFKLIVDTGDWDMSLGTNSPGQAGNPDDPHYRNLFPIWASDQYFPVFYSKSKIQSVADEVMILKPVKQ